MTERSSPNTPSADRAGAQPAPDPRGRILIVDDQAAFRRLLVRVLADAGHEVVEAGDGRKALELARAARFHVVLTDMRMPGLDGLDLLARLQAEMPETQVVLVTAHGSVPSAVQAMRQGAFDYLTKPLADPDEVVVVVERALAHRRLLDAEAVRAADAGVQVVHQDAAMVAVMHAVRRVAAVDTTVLLSGESGTGKEVVARALHAGSTRAARPFVAVNCAALAEGLLDSELFGHERGAFTGADRQRRGRFELADGGTLLLDEVGEMSPALQAKVLRVLQERRFERLGGTTTLHVDVRVIAATHRDLRAEVAAGRFREDLYYRLAVVPIHLPPLRERGQDVVLLARHALASIGRRLGRPGLRMDDAAVRALLAYPWPGNVRELNNVIERAVVLGASATLTAGDLRLDAPQGAAERPLDLRAREREAIREALAQVGGHRQRAADLLGLSLRALQYKLKQFDLR